ncbi:MAG TPA: amidase [Chitinophagaceae bacterium]|nr:amidase [Chitinophagaceae bacterium]
MDRRKFLFRTTATGLSVTLLAACNTTPPKATEGVKEGVAAETDDFMMNEITVDELQEAMRKGDLSSRVITQRYLDRIAAIDKKGPAINSVIEVNPDALSIADAMDEERKQGKVRGPLHGIPVLIKDNIDTGDKMMTTAGALALEGNIASKDAFIVAKLREAGAVLLGKTNLSEWANFRSNRSSSGWSSRGGQTKNPYVLDRNPCGSSSGTGAAVAANLCAVGIGTETDGSIIAPSSFCGIVGIKPTVGLWSRSGIIPISATQDTAGPMTRTVKDAAILLAACAGEDPADNVTAASTGKIQPDYTSFCKTDALKGKRIGVEKDYLEGHEGVVALYKQAIEVLKQQGAEVVEVDVLKMVRSGGDSEYLMMQYEFKDGVNKYLAGANAKVKTLAEVIAFNKANEDRAMPYFKQDILELCDERKGLEEKEYKEALAKSKTAAKLLDEIMVSNKLDAVCSTSYGPANLIDLVHGDYSVGFYFSGPAARAGYPHITVPMGQVSGLPVGFSFVAGPWEEGKIIGLAYAYEQASKKRVAPGFKPTV